MKSYFLIGSRSRFGVRSVVTGWVSGPLYGAIGLLGIATGGALGGLGLGALANIIRNPDKYNMSVSTVLVTLAAGTVLASWLALAVGRKCAQVNGAPFNDQTKVPDKR